MCLATCDTPTNSDCSAHGSMECGRITWVCKNQESLKKESFKKKVRGVKWNEAKKLPYLTRILNPGPPTHRAMRPGKNPARFMTISKLRRHRTTSHPSYGDVRAVVALPGDHQCTVTPATHQGSSRNQIVCEKINQFFKSKGCQVKRSGKLALDIRYVTNLGRIWFTVIQFRNGNPDSKYTFD